MSDELPDPLVPPEVDLRDFAFMPLDIRRLLSSETWVLGTDAERVAAMNLWCESWHQVPAASIPSDDRMLSHLSRSGTRWKKVRAAVLRGWTLCSDGRWYHPVVAEKAIEAWHKKERQRERSKKGNEKRWGSLPGGNVSRRVEGGGTSRAGAEGDLRGDDQGQHEEIPEGSCSGVPEGQKRDIPTASLRDATRSPSSIPQRSQGTGTGTGSVPNGTGGPPPAAPSDDLALAVFTRGLAWLAKATGKPDGACRNLLGKWRKGRTDGDLLDVLSSAQRKVERDGALIDPIAWIEKTLQDRRSANGTNPYASVPG